jgi:hypothetical protein
VELGIHKSYCLFPLHANGSKVWVQRWDFGTTNSSPIQLPKISIEEPQLNFVSGIPWQTRPSFVEDRAIGKKVFRLSGKYKEPDCAQWDGWYLIVGYIGGEVLILDFNNFL